MKKFLHFNFQKRVANLETLKLTSNRNEIKGRFDEHAFEGGIALEIESLMKIVWNTKKNIV